MAPSWENTQAAVQELLCETMPKWKARLDPKELWMSGHESALMGLFENQKRCRSNLERLRDKRTSKAFHEAQLDFNRSRKQITNLQRQCQHKYRQYWGNVLENDPSRKKDAERHLKSDGNISGEALEKISPDKFRVHFSKLFGKQSESETINPLGEPLNTNWSFSGPPTVAEVRTAIKELKPNKAAGADSLPGECFKAGDEIMVSRLPEDFKSIWPVVETGSGPDRPQAPGSPQQQRGQDSGDVAPEEVASERAEPNGAGSGTIPNRTKNATMEEYTSCQTAVSQSWQDTILVALFKNKGSPLDPGNSCGIFLLEVAGKILAGILNKRLQVLLEGWMSDLQCGFRRSRGTLQQILCIRRAQQALKEADATACILFIDFAKAFDSPPRSAIWACLRHIGCPPDVLAVIVAIHAQPVATVRHTDVNFPMSRGIRQGCMLGPTLFIILLNVVMEKSGCRDVIGVEFVCKDRGVWTCPSDIRDENFWTTDGQYADDAWFLADRPDQLTEALHRLQAVTGPLGLDVSVKKTEWL